METMKNPTTEYRQTCDKALKDTRFYLHDLTAAGVPQYLDTFGKKLVTSQSLKEKEMNQ